MGLLFLAVHVSSVELDSDAPSVIQLSHSLGSVRKLEPRGQINVRSLKTGSLSVQQDLSIDLRSLQEASELNEFYHLEALVKTNGVERTFLTSTKAVTMKNISYILIIRPTILKNL